MDYYIYSLSHHTVPITLRETLYLNEERTNRFYALLKETGKEGFALFTCNRLEIYLCGFSNKPEDFLKKTFLSVFSQPIQHLHPYARIFTGREAVRHSFRVAGGLDSLVLGEPQILGQWKKAFFLGKEKGGVNTHLLYLGERTIQVAKRVRTETGISKYALSIPSLIPRLGEEIFGDLSQRKALVIGAGEMGKLTLRYLKKRVGSLFLSSRTLEHAQKTGAPLGVTTIPWEKVLSFIGEVDMVVFSVGGVERAFSYEEIKDALKHSSSFPKLFVDLSVPLVLDPKIGKEKDLFFYTVDHLKEVAEKNLLLKKEDLVRAEEIIESAVEKFETWYGDQIFAPLLREINEILEEIRRKELSRSKGNSEEAEKTTSYLIRTLMKRIATFTQEKRDPTFLKELIKAFQEKKPRGAE